MEKKFIPHFLDLLVRKRALGKVQEVFFFFGGGRGSLSAIDNKQACTV